CDVQIHVVDGAVLRCVADYGTLPASTGREPIPLSGDLVAGKAVLTKKTIHLRDLGGPSWQRRSGRARNGYHSILVAPLMHDGTAIGTISLGRKQAHPFSAEQVETIPTLSSVERLPIVRDLGPGRAIADRCIVHVADLLAEPEDEFAGAK